ncbi:MAG: tyrosine--tRNA ligase [Bacteroidota bacterium]
MNIIEELRWRGMLQDFTPGIEEYFESGKRTAYIGFDPTAPSLTIGNYVQVMLLTHLQRHGHQPIILMGGATGRVGDPSGKDQERQLKTYEELDHNLAFQQRQFSKFLNFEEGENKALFVNNYDFYADMNVLDFLRQVGKTLTVNYMMSKESVKKRIETGISFTEFSYQLLQGYDFQCLFEKYGCSIQMGGSDQWGNITAGTEFIRRNLSEKAYAVTTPLLTKADGSKFGKSEKGNIWLDPEMTSPYRFYQFWINADDRDLAKFFRYFSLKSKEEIEDLEAEYSENPRALKQLLAEELTKRVHSGEDYDSVQKVTQLLFNKKASQEQLLSLSENDLKMVASEIPSFIIPKDSLANGLNIIDLLAEYTQIVASKSDARRAIKGNAISVNKAKINNHEHSVTTENLLQSKYLMVENGKKNKYMLMVE